MESFEFNKLIGAQQKKIKVSKDTNIIYVRGTGQIPNAVVSRYPILDGGHWADPKANNRDFAWARIDIPGPVDLWAISVHLLTSGSSKRKAEASELAR